MRSCVCIDNGLDIRITGVCDCNKEIVAMFYLMRKKSKWSLAKASSMLGVSPPYLSRVESNQQKPSFDLVCKMSFWLIRKTL